LQERGSVRHYRLGEEVQRQQVVPSGAAWLQAGRLRSVIYLGDGEEQLVGWVMPGELVGVYNLLLPGDVPSPVTLRADTDAVSLLHFSRDLLLETMREWPDARVGIAMGLSRRILQLHDIIDISGPRPLQDKLRAVLAWWAHQYAIPARDGSIELWVSQADLANAVGASRQRVHMELKQLQAEGCVELAYRKIIVRPLFAERLRLFLDPAA
jgi:CRP-like cAMP-binding protein